MKKFIIEHIDPLGQGVFKENDQIYFIPKTLPKETGTFEILKSKKGVNFGKLISLDKVSNTREIPACTHFADCSGCHFLHTDYSSELGFKLNSYRKLLKQLDLAESKIKTIESPTRLHYRNRIQLHYHTGAEVIGFKSASNKIVPVPDCKIMDPLVEKSYQLFLKTWLTEAKKHNKRMGHVEIYNRNEQVIISWNKPYAHGGFSQINSDVNEKLQLLVNEYLNDKNLKVLDLFGGAGNLSANLDVSNKLCVDLYPDEKRNNNFFHLNLFDEDALQIFKDKNSIDFDTLIIDPPRSGFKDINKWVQFFSPKKIIYVSCHPATMVRDLKQFHTEYSSKEVHLIDLFPSTFHYESMIFLEKK